LGGKERNNYLRSTASAVNLLRIYKKSKLKIFCIRQAEILEGWLDKAYKIALDHVASNAYIDGDGTLHRKFP